MTAAILTLAGAGGATGGGGGGGGFGNPPNALVWNNIYGSGTASTQFLTIAGVGGGTAPITITNSGAGTVLAIKDGVSTLYSGSFNVATGDTLGWMIINLSTSAVSGTITVTSGTFTVGTFTYVVHGNNYF